MYTVTFAWFTDLSNYPKNLFTIYRCVNRTQEQSSRLDSLYIGGINFFVLHLNSTVNFLGGIRNVIVGGIRLNHLCAANEVNVVKGNVCVTPCNTVIISFTLFSGYVRSRGCAEMTCDPSRTSQCVDYAKESYCRCLGGFSSQACRSSNNQDVSSKLSCYGLANLHAS